MRRIVVDRCGKDDYPLIATVPLPTGTDLPHGHMDVLVATTLTDEEMLWSQKNGRAALLGKLKAAGVGQISIPDRASVVQ